MSPNHRARRRVEGERLGDAPIEEQFRKDMNEVARALDELFNGSAKGPHRKVGFVLMTFAFGDEPGARVNFISNGADRKDVVALMKEMIARFEGQPEIQGHA